MRYLISAILMVCIVTLSNAQVFTFACMDSTQLTGINCDVCPVTNITSRSFCGLLIYRNAVPYKWIDQPYTVRLKPGNSVEYLEQIPSISGIQTQDRITISVAQTGFSTARGMIDSTLCHCITATPETTLFYASDSIDNAPIFRGDTFTIVGRDLAHVSFDSLLRKYVIQVDSVSGGGGGATDLSFSVSASSPVTLFSSTGNDVGIIAGTGIGLGSTATDLTITNTGDLSNTNEIQQIDTFTIVSNVLRASLSSDGVPFKSVDLSPYVNPVANNGLSDNENGGNFRLGNRYMNGSDGLFGTDRKVNVNAFMGFFGDNSDSTLLTIDGTNDRIGIGILPTNRLDVSGASGTYIRVGTSGAVANSGLILNNSADVADTWAVYRQGDGDFAIGADADNEWPNGTLTNPFIIKPSPPDNSFYMDASGFIALAGTTAARRLDNYGETRLRDLTTDTPTGIVGHDADGDLGTITVGSGLSLSGGSLTSTAGTFYQTMRDNNAAETQRAALNFVSSASVSALLTDDAANGETEATFAIPNNAISNALIRQGVARSVIGVTGNATANVADIQGTTDQVLRVNTAGTGLGFGQIATGGITDDAVTYTKIQNVVSDDVFLGRISGAGGNIEELTAANAYTILGLTGVANRFALWTGTNTLASDAAFTFDAANDRATFSGTVSGVGANTGILNLNSGAIAASTTFLRMSGNITNNMIGELVNANNAATTANALFTLSTGGANAGDPVLQFNISGQKTTAVGLDNNDGDKFKVTPGSTVPGGNANASFVANNDAAPLYGFNIDAPARTVDVAGGARAVNLINTTAPPTWDNLDTGLGAGGVVNSTTGGNNGFQVNFTTGTAPAASGAMFRLVLANPFTITQTPVLFCKSVTALNECDKFSINGNSPAFINIKANGTLTANTNYILNIVTIGQ